MENKCGAAIRQVLEESGDGNDFLDVSGTDKVDHCETRKGDSKSKLNCDSSSGDEDDDFLDQTDFVKAIQMKNKKIVNSTGKKGLLWSKRAKRNLLKHLLCVKVPAKNVQSCSEIWKCPVTASMVQLMYCTVIAVLTSTLIQ